MVLLDVRSETNAAVPRLYTNDGLTLCGTIVFRISEVAATTAATCIEKTFKRV